MNLYDCTFLSLFDCFALQRAISRLRKLERQEMKKGCHDTLLGIQANINRLLRNRSDASAIPLWNRFFESIPPSHHVAHSSYYDVLGLLAMNYGGPVKTRERVSSAAVKSASYYVSPITFRGGPVNKAEREAIEKSLGLFKPFRFEADDSDDDEPAPKKKKAIPKKKATLKKKAAPIRKAASKKKKTAPKKVAVKKKVTYDDGIMASSESECQELEDDVEDVSGSDSPSVQLDIDEESVSSGVSESDDESLPSLNDDSSGDEVSSDSDNDEHSSIVHKFSVGEVLRNCHNLRGTITACNKDGTYAIMYQDGQEDFDIAEDLLKPVGEF